jgi:hypothetical protein
MSQTLSVPQNTHLMRTMNSLRAMVSLTCPLIDRHVTNAHTDMHEELDGVEPVFDINAFYNESVAAFTRDKKKIARVITSSEEMLDTMHGMMFGLSFEPNEETLRYYDDDEVLQLYFPDTWRGIKERMNLKITTEDLLPDTDEHLNRIRALLAQHTVAPGSGNNPTIIDSESEEGSVHGRDVRSSLPASQARAAMTPSQPEPPSNGAIEVPSAHINVPTPLARTAATPTSLGLRDDEIAQTLILRVKQAEVHSREPSDHLS